MQDNHSLPLEQFQLILYFAVTALDIEENNNIIQLVKYGL